MAGPVTRRLFLSDVSVNIRCDCPAITEHIDRQWAAATRPMIDTRSELHIAVTANDRLTIGVNGDTVWNEDVDEERTSVFDLVLYRHLLANHRGRFGVFHAAAVVGAGATWVFCGPSGAGKSSLALAAIARGYRYFTDEFVVTDGRSLWGWPRTIYFDAQRKNAALAPWLDDLRYDNAYESRYHVPSSSKVARSATPAEQVHFVQIERGSVTTIEPIAPTAGLCHWTEAAFSPLPLAIGNLVGSRRTWRATWRHPDALLESLEALPSVVGLGASGAV